uniref:Uncharacterized protein n=1 Tax=Aegilops tauschii subsp. strangulata TaxID=200361 RepID=A0A453C9J0_AEGTS
ENEIQPHTHGLASSPSRPRSHRRRRPRRPLPASYGAAQHGPELPMLRASLPSGHILISRPLLPARNHTPVARVPGSASPARLRRPQMQMEHAMRVPHPPWSPSSRASSRKCEGRHGPAATQGLKRRQYLATRGQGVFFTGYVQSGELRTTA